MLHLDLRSRIVYPTPAPAVLRSPIPPKNVGLSNPGCNKGFRQRPLVAGPLEIVPASHSLEKV